MTCKPRSFSKTKSPKPHPDGRPQKPKSHPSPDLRVGDVVAVSKKEKLLMLLSGRRGMTIASLGKELGWTSRTVHSMLSRLRKADYEIVSRQDENGRRLYRVEWWGREEETGQ